MLQTKVTACGHVVLLMASPEATECLKLINPSYDAYPELATVEQEINDAGFRECFRRQFQVSIDMCPPFEEEFVEFVAATQAQSGVYVDAGDVRAVLEREFGDKSFSFSDTRYLIVYRKPQPPEK